MTDQWCSKRNSWAFSNQGASDVRLGHDLPGSAEGCKMYHGSSRVLMGSPWKDTIHSHWKQLLIRKCRPWIWLKGVFHWWNCSVRPGSFRWKKSQSTASDVENLAKKWEKWETHWIYTLPISVRTFRQISDPKVELWVMEISNDFFHGLENRHNFCHAVVA